MAEGTFNVKRLPGASTLAITCFVILYVPMGILVAYSFNSGRCQSARKLGSDSLLMNSGRRLALALQKE